MSTPNYARKVYFSVVEDVISNVREAFLDEGVDEQVLQELKQLWESKLTASRAMDPAVPEPVVPSNIPYPLLQQQQSSQPTVVPTSSNLQQQIPIPVQINADGQISNAASMAFSAQGGMFPQQLQALVNVNPGAQLTLQQTANGQYILQALAPATQGQMVNLQQQQQQQPTIIQAQPGQIQQVQGQTLPQYDGAHDDTHTSNTEHTCTGTTATEQATSSHDSVRSCSMTCGGCQPEMEIEFEASKALSKKLVQDIKHSLNSRVPQLDGNHDTSSSEDDDYDDDDGNDDDDDEKEEGEEEGEEEEPLNSGDDVSEEDPTELFDTDNVVVCQFEKISRNKSKWKFNLKDGIMNLEGKDHVFQRGIGDADW